ncbi:hypothetical protein F5887DRAFT_1281048 [Amanita rubescens]|nr:hypothetical protein F5887DRAFT_1281048 [Amanita rubescens]
MSSETSGSDFHSCSSCSYNSDYYSDYCSSCSMNSTPHRRGVSDAGYTIDDMRAELQRDVSERIADEKLNIYAFLSHVWGLSEQALDKILKAAETLKSSLPTDLVQAYKAAFDHEPKAYRPFLDISKHLIEELEKIGLPVLDSFDRFQTSRGGWPINNGHNLRKPDIVVSFEPTEITWSNVIAPFEFKTRDKSARKSHGRVLPEGPIQASSRTSLFHAESAPVSHSRRLLFDESVLRDTRGGATSRDQPGRSGVTASLSCASSSMPPGSQAARAELSNAVEGGIHVEFRSRSETPSSRQAKARVGEKSTTSKKRSSSKPPRSRASSTSSARVNLNRKSKPEPIEPQLSSSMKRKADDTLVSLPRKRQNKKSSLNRDHMQLARYALECMAAASRHYVTGVFVDRFNISLWYYDRATVAHTIPFNFEDEPHLLAMVLYALCECTPRQAGFDPFIIPASESCPSDINQLFETAISAKQSKGDQVTLVLGDQTIKSFSITGDRLFANRGLLGRGTNVFPVEEIGGNEDDENADLVLKLIWPDNRRKREADVIHQLREAIPDMAQHLPNVLCSADMTAEQVRLPSHSLGIKVIQDLERCFHALVMSRYKALWMVDSVEEFQNVFVDCVECHYTAYRRGRVLHRDLSINNLMCDKKRTGHIGVLLDWDLASLIDELNAVIPSNAQHRTGTIPFMSISLLRGNTPHRYCHDLESFFYILIWAAVHFDLQKKQCLPTQPKFEDWNNSDLARAARAKSEFLDYPEGISPCVLEDFNDLFLTWIKPLRRLFFKAYNTNDLELEFELEMRDAAAWSEARLKRLEKQITFESFMSAIGRKPRRDL